MLAGNACNGSREPFKAIEMISDGGGPEEIAVVFEGQAEAVPAMIDHVQAQLGLCEGEGEIQGLHQCRQGVLPPGADIDMDGRPL